MFAACSVFSLLLWLVCLNPKAIRISKKGYFHGQFLGKTAKEAAFNKV